MYFDLKLLYITDVPEEGEVRMFYSPYEINYYSGLLQIWLNGQWGVVSDTFWTVHDTNTVCRQLGRNGKVHIPIITLK